LPRDQDSLPRSGATSLPFISAPILQNTTCEALLDPRKLLCENSSIVALIPCQKFNSDKSVEITKSDTFDPIGNIDLTDNFENSECPNVLQTDLLAEILSSAQDLNVLHVLSPHSENCDVNTPNEIIEDSNSSGNRETEITCPKLEECFTYENTSIEMENDDNQEKIQTNWGSDNDDGFKDVIDAINRLCDTMSNSVSQSNYTQVTSACEYLHRYENVQDEDEKIDNVMPTEESSLKETEGVTIADRFLSNMAAACDSDEVLESVTVDNSEHVMIQDDQTKYCSSSDPVPIPYPLSSQLEDASGAESSSPALVEDDSSTNHTDILQYSMCSSSLNEADDVSIYYSAEQLPKVDDVPPPGHVAAMRLKFETYTNVNMNFMRLLKKDDEFEE
jgi:hypothetical protein